MIFIRTVSISRVSPNGRPTAIVASGMVLPSEERAQLPTRRPWPLGGAPSGYAVSLVAVIAGKAQTESGFA